MLKRMALWAVLAIGAILPGAARSEDKKPAGPAVVVRIQSINELLKTAKYFGKFVDEDQRNQLEQILSFAASLIDEKKGLEGVGADRPIGLYVMLSQDNPSPSVVALVPVADEETLLGALKDRAMLEVKKEKDGSYMTAPQQLPMPVYFRFANKYAYISNDSANIEAKGLPKPADVLTGNPADLISISAKINQIPEGLRKLAISAFEDQVANAKEQPLPVDSKAMKEFRDKAIDEVVGTVKSVLNESDAFTVRINVDPKTDELGLDIELTGLKGSKLAGDIASVKKSKSVIGGALSSLDGAMTLNLSTALSAALRKALPATIDDAIEQAKKQGNVPAEAQKLVEPLVNALKPSLKSGEYDLGFSMVGPTSAGKWTLIGGLKLTEGKKIEDAVKKLLKEIPPEQAQMLKVDAAKLTDSAMLHLLKLPPEAFDGEVSELFGKGDVHLTFRDDAVLIAFGAEAKELLTKAAKSSAADTGIFVFTMSAAKLAHMPSKDAPRNIAEVKKLSEKVFGKDPKGSDVIKISLDGGDSMKLRISAKAKALIFFAELGQMTTLQKVD